MPLPSWTRAPSTGPGRKHRARLCGQPKARITVSRWELVSPSPTWLSTLCFLLVSKKCWLSEKWPSGLLSLGCLGPSLMLSSGGSFGLRLLPLSHVCRQNIRKHSSSTLIPSQGPSRSYQHPREILTLRPGASYALTCLAQPLTAFSSSLFSNQ